MTKFFVNGIEYRTNADASVVEGHDGRKWNRTFSLAIRAEALKALEPVLGCYVATDDGISIIVPMQ